MSSTSNGKQGIDKPQTSTGAKKKDYDITRPPVRVDRSQVEYTMFAWSSGKAGYNFHPKPQSNQRSACAVFPRRQTSGPSVDGTIKISLNV